MYLCVFVYLVVGGGGFFFGLYNFLIHKVTLLKYEKTKYKSLLDTVSMTYCINDLLKLVLKDRNFNKTVRQESNNGYANENI